MMDVSEKKVFLKPVRTRFMILSMVAAALLNFIPLGAIVWRPDILALVLVFWSVHQPRKISFTVVFICGLVMDVHYGALLGQHALIYVLICLVGAAGSRRILWFGLFEQMLHVLPLFILLHVFAVCVHWIQGDVGLSWWVMIAPLIETVLWVVADLVLLAPQRRSPEAHGGL